MNKLPNEIILTDRECGFEMSDELAERFCDEVNEYLANAYGYTNEGWCYQISLTDIMWEKEDE